MRSISIRGRAIFATTCLLLVVALSGLAACSVSSSSPTTQQTPKLAPGTAGVGTPTAVPAIGPFNVSLTTRYALSSCDASEPADSDLHRYVGIGAGDEQRRRLSRWSACGGPRCMRRATAARVRRRPRRGTVQITESDAVTFTGTGTFCRAMQTATFTYTITGGTGAYAQASGAGTINVPTPSSPTDDAESWSGTLLT